MTFIITYTVINKVGIKTVCRKFVSDQDTLNAVLQFGKSLKKNSTAKLISIEKA